MITEAGEGLKANSMAPDFSLVDSNGKTIKLSDFRGKKRVVVYFYPKDFTPGCTTEAIEFSRDYDKYRDANIEIIGISPDNEESHKKFRQEMKIPYLLGSDLQNQISKEYGVYGLKRLMGREYMGVNRSTFLIDENGKIVKVFPKVKPIAGKGFPEILDAFKESEEIGK
jgi:thioredoxin-dependent peroxiredoxin